MNYRPPKDELKLWDTWLYLEPNRQRIHLFFLANLPDKHWDRIGHAATDDLLNWEDMPTIIPEHEENKNSGIGTGMVFAMSNSCYCMSYTTNMGGIKDQSIAFMQSNDLINWVKMDSAGLTAMEPYYETDVNTSTFTDLPFRDAFVLKNGEYYEALVCAESKDGPDGLRGCIGRFRTKDEKLTKWETMAPLLGPGIQSQMEVPEYFEMKGYHYLLWSNNYFMGPSITVSGREGCTGTFYAIADSYGGSYKVPNDNLLIGARDYPSSIQSYVGRVFVWEGQHLLYHHIAGYSPALGLPKRLTSDSDGRIEVCYWEDIEKLHREVTNLPLDSIKTFGRNYKSEKWTILNNNSLTGQMTRIGSMSYVPGDYDNFHLRCNMTVQTAKRAGVCVRYSQDNNLELGVAIIACCEKGVWQLARPQGVACKFMKPFENGNDSHYPIRNETYCIDIICRDEFYEVYVDKRWMFTRWFEDLPSKGCVAFYVEDGTARFDEIQIWKLDSLDNR